MRILATILLVVAGRAFADAPEPEPWLQKRDITAFQDLLDASPFSLPTAEESSPVADRYALTGALGLDGDAIVFVFDRTTQARHMVSKKPNAENMSLVEYLPSPDPRQMRATIRIGGEMATIGFAEAAAADPSGQQVSASNPGTPQAMPAGQPPGVIAAGGIPQQGIVPANGQGGPPQPPRRVIRRRIISGQ